MPIVQRPLAAVIARGDGAGAPPARPRRPHGRRHRPALRRSGGRLRGQRRRRRPGRGRPGDDRLQRGRLARRRQGRRRDRLLERRGRRAAPAGRPDPRSSRSTIRRPALPGADPDHLAQDARTTTRTWSTRWSPRPTRGYEFTVDAPGAGASTTCSPQCPSLDRAEQAGPAAGAAARPPPAPVRPGGAAAPGRAWDLEHGLLERPLDVEAAFAELELPDTLAAREPGRRLPAGARRDAARLDGPRARPADRRREPLRRHRGGAEPGQRPALLARPTGTGGCSSPTASATPPRAETVKGVLAKLDADGIARRDAACARCARAGAEVVQMWGRPESVREEFRERRSL